jgi:hypothetical protein
METALEDRIAEAKEAIVQKGLKEEIFIKRTPNGYLSLYDKVTRKCIRVSYPSEMVHWLRITTFLPRQDIP